MNHKAKYFKVEWMDYSGYDECEQLHSTFEDSVSILDFIFNHGSCAAKFMRSFN